MPTLHQNACSLCGAPIPTFAGGQCPACLLRFADAVPDPPQDNDLLSPGQIRYFGDYELEDEIARGGMGVVYRARQLSLNRPVAIKMILAGQLATPEAVSRFSQEAEAAAALDHPNIVPVYEIGEHQTQHYFSMKLIGGARPISHWAAELAASAAPRTVAAALEKVARAIAYAHARGILHRDLKPQNILVGSDGEPVVTDFGLAKFIGVSHSKITLSTDIVGSPAYMAPEQASGETGVTTAVDIYGLGAVLYELLTGHPPFEGSTALSVLTKLQESQPSKPRTYNPRTPPDIENICLKCLEKRPSSRYPSALHLADDLARFTRGEPVTARQLSPPEIAWRWVCRNPVISTLAAAFAVALVSGTTGVVIQRNRATAANTQLRENIASLQWSEIDSALQRGERQRAVASLAAILRNDPSHWQATNFATSILDQHPFPLLAAPPMPGVNASAISPDGTVLATARPGGEIHINHTSTGAPHTSPFLLSTTPSGLHFHPRLPLLAATSPETAATIIDLTNLTTRNLPAPGHVHPSTDGSTLIVRTSTTIEAYDWNGVKTRQSITAPGRFVSDDTANHIATWADRQIVAWNFPTGDPIFDLQLDSRATHADISGDGTHVAVATTAGVYHVIDLTAARTVATHPVGDTHLKHLALDRTGTRTTLIFHDGTSRIFDSGTGEPISPTLPHDYDFTAVRFSSDRTRMLLAGDQRRVRLWSLEDSALLCEPIFTELPTRTLAFATDAPSILVETGAAATVWIPSHRSTPKTFSVPGESFLEASRVTSDGRYAFLGAWRDSPKTIVFDQQTGSVLHTLPLRGSAYAQLYHPPTGRYIAVSSNGFLQAWSLPHGSPLWGPVKQPGSIHPALMTPDGKHFVTATTRGLLRIYEATTGELLHESSTGSHVRSLQLSPEGDTLVSASGDGTLATWRLPSGTPLMTIPAHKDIIVSTTLSPTGDRIATASHDRTARIWDSKSGRPATPPLLHVDELSHVAFSPDGTRLATAARDGTARIWNAADGTPLTQWMNHPSTAETVRFSPDGNRLIVRFHGGFRIWDGQSGLPVSEIYPFPVSGGLGIDSPTLRDILSPDGTQVWLGTNSAAISIWDITPPPPTCPPWFPEFLEAVARLKRQPDGTFSLVPARAQLELRETIAPLTGWHADWANRFLGLPGKE